MNNRVAALSAVLGSLALSATASATETLVPEPFRGFDDESTYSISYADLNTVLNTLVVEAGPSGRAVIDMPRDITGTRLKPKVSKFTEYEGNRFYYSTFKDNEAGRQYLVDIQKSLEALPSEIPLENFSRDEQLAYWLNLYNVTVLNQVIDAFPKRNLKRLAHGRNSFLDEKLLTVSGVPLSLNDIQFTILRNNYDNNPLIIYGLYQGYVGSPDIRRTAYDAGSVYHTLEENAYAFINSNRGTFSRSDEDFIRVSSFYDRNRAFFPEFETDLTRHLLEFIDGTEREHLQAATHIKPDINDFTVTDLRGTNRRIGGSLAHNQAALMDSYRGDAKTVFGGTKIASLKVDKPEEEPEEEVDIEDLERFPVEGARVEDLESAEKE